MYSLNRDAKWLAWFEEMFTRIAGEDRQISLEEFKGVLKVTKVSRLSLDVIHMSCMANCLFISSIRTAFLPKGSSHFLMKTKVEPSV